MKAVKIILGIVGGLIGLLVVGFAILWFGYLTPPAAADVCGNVEKLWNKENVSIPFPAKAKQECLDRAGTEPIAGRNIYWVKNLKCTRDAQTMAELKECDKIKAP